MSVIRKKPFIQTLVEDLTEAQKASLLGVMNGLGSTEEATFGDLPEDAIAPVLFKFSEIDSKTGILIQSDNYTVLIAYHRFQDLLMFKINSNNTYEKINEYLDINELRNLLEDSGDVVIGDDLAVGGKLEVTGTSEFKDDVEIKGDLLGASNLIYRIDAFESTTLTDDQIQEIIKGCYMNGQYLNVTDPMFLPARAFGSGRYYAGILIGNTSGTSKISCYLIDTNDNSIVATSNRYIMINNVSYFNDKEVPVYPSNTGTFTLKCVNGVLTWVADA